MLALRRTTDRPALYTVTVASLLVLLWSEGWKNGLVHTLTATGNDGPLGDLIMLFAWLLREEAWWWTITLCAALVTSLLLRSAMGRSAASWLNRPAVAKAPRPGSAGP
jgi:hypothetical protein